MMNGTMANREDWWLDYGFDSLMSALKDTRVMACLVEGGVARFRAEYGRGAERDPGDEDEVSP